MSLLQDLDFAFDQGRNQYHSTLILEELAKKAPASAIKVLAITDVDLFIPIMTYVYGEAQLDGKACIISTSRLKKGVPLHSVMVVIHPVWKYSLQTVPYLSWMPEPEYVHSATAC